MADADNSSLPLPKVNPVPLIDNSVCSAHLHPRPSSLSALALEVFAEYRGGGNRHAAPCMFLNNVPRCQVMIRETGTVNMMGGRSSSRSLLALYMVRAYIFEQYGELFEIRNFKTSNLHATIKFGHTINQETLHRAYPSSSYNDTIISHVKLKLGSGATCLVYENGSVVVTGVKDTESILRAFDDMYRELRQYVIGSHTLCDL